MTSEFPIRITIEPTNHCNLNCLPCPRHHITMPMGYMDWGLFDKLLADIKLNSSRCPYCTEVIIGHTVILAWRGEPTLHPRISHISQSFRSICDVVIATNGQNYKDLPYLGNLHALNVSIHNEQSVKTLYQLLQDKINYHVQFKLTASRVLGETSDDLWEQAKGLVCTGDTPWDKHSIDEYREYTEHSAGGVWGSIRAGGPRYTLSGQRKGLCHRLETDLVIAWDGSISRCCYVWSTVPGLNANNMTLSEIWQSPELQGIRDRYPDHICSRCDQWRSDKTL